MGFTNYQKTSKLNVLHKTLLSKLRETIGIPEGICGTIYPKTLFRQKVNLFDLAHMESH